MWLFGIFGKRLHLLTTIVKQQHIIMGTQADLAAQLAALSDQLVKAKGEIVAKIADLETAIGNQDNVSPELQAAFDALKPAAQALDDIVPDVVVGGSNVTDAPAAQ